MDKPKVNMYLDQKQFRKIMISAYEIGNKENKIKVDDLIQYLVLSLSAFIEYK